MADNPFDCLTAHEATIAQQLARGQSCGMIAQLLKINSKTVDTHRYNILQKIGLGRFEGNKSVALARLALRYGLVSLEDAL